MSQHSIRIYSPTGEFLRSLRWKSIDCSLVEGGGVLTIALFPEYRDDLFARDSRIAYLRAPEGAFIETGKLVGDTMWLLTRRRRIITEAGQHSIALICQHPNALLGRRVVAYDEGSAEANKSDIASDVIYDYLDENFVSATDTARNVSSAHFLLDARPSPTFGPSAPIAGSYRTVLELIQDICRSAAAQGTYMNVEVYVQSPPGPFRVRIYRNQRGANRGSTSGQPLIISPSSAKMVRASVDEDWSTAVSFVYAGGAGNLDERVVQTQEDTTLSAQSPFGRFEHFESFNTDDTAILGTEAYKVLRDYRPHRAFDGSVTPVAEQYSGAIYDVNYTWGDIVNVRFQAPLINNFGQAYAWELYSFDVRVNPVHIQVVRQFDEFQNVIGTDEQVEITLQSIDSA